MEFRYLQIFHMVLLINYFCSISRGDDAGQKDSGGESILGCAEPPVDDQSQQIEIGDDIDASEKDKLLESPEEDSTDNEIEGQETPGGDISTEKGSEVNPEDENASGAPEGTPTVGSSDGVTGGGQDQLVAGKVGDLYGGGEDSSEEPPKEEGESEAPGEGAEGTEATGEGAEGTEATGEGAEATGEGVEGTGATGGGGEGTDTTIEVHEGSEASDEVHEGSEATGEEGEGTEATGEEGEGTEATGEEGEGTEATDKVHKGTEATYEEGEGTEATDEGGEGTEATGEGGEGSEATDKEFEGTEATIERGKGTETTDEGGEGSESIGEEGDGSEATDEGFEGTEAAGEGFEGTEVTGEGDEGSVVIGEEGVRTKTAGKGGDGSSAKASMKKPGACDKVKAKKQTFCSRVCDIDMHCPSTEKCCGPPTKRCCQRVKPPMNIEKRFGVCDRLHVMGQETCQKCKYDSECPETQKCCGFARRRCCHRSLHLENEHEIADDLRTFYVLL